MHKVNPPYAPSLTDKELINFCERYLPKGLPPDYQAEILKRFTKLTDK